MMTAITRRLLATRHVPVLRASYALILTTGANAVLGLLFWVLVARLYPARAVGEAAGLISAMVLVSSVGWLGLQYVLMRFVPAAGRRSGRLIALAYAAAACAALAAAVGFLVLVAGAVGLGAATAGPLAIGAFLGAVAAWVVFSLQDPALIGLARATWVPVENSAFGALKAAAVVALAATGSSWAIFGAWAGSAALAAVVVNSLIYGRVLPARRADPLRLPGRRGLARFAAGQHAVAVVAAIPDSLVPLLVIAYLGTRANAHYYAAWTIGFSIRLIAVNIASALLAEAGGSDEPLAGLLRPAVRLGAGILVPVSLLTAIGGSVALQMYGSDYGEATAALRLFGLSLLPFAVVTVALTVERVRQRSARALVVVGVSTSVTVALDVLLLPSMGVTATGWACLAAQTLAAAVGLALVLRGAPGPRRGQRTGGARLGARRLRARSAAP